MITSVAIKNFMCFEDFEVSNLGPFSVLIGPNDSGKSAFLQAIRIVAALPPVQDIAEGDLGKKLGIRFGSHLRWRQQAVDTNILVTAQRRDGTSQAPFTVRYPQRAYRLFSDVAAQPLLRERAPQNWKALLHADVLGQTAYYQLDPAALRKPSLVRKGDMTLAGYGFPTFLDDMHRQPGGQFAACQAEFCRRFSHYDAIILDKTTVLDVKREDATTIEKIERDAFALSFHGRHGEHYPAEAVSDGVMLSLAFMAICAQPNPPKILLIEEPENGVHHASLKEIVTTLQGLAKEKDVQVFVTTHSPYLLDLVEPEQVLVFNKNDQGAVHAKRLSEYPDVPEMKKDFMTGEIWTVLSKTQGI